VTVGLSLLSYAVLLSMFGPQLLVGRRATSLSPGLGTAAWLAAACSAVSAAVLGGLALAVPELPHSLSEVLAACTDAFPPGDGVMGGRALTATALVLAAAVGSRAAWCVVATLVTNLQFRHRHQDALRIVGRPSASPPAVVVDSDLALIYCLPGRHRQVVLTSGALRALSRPQLDAALAHEHAHLRGRHHLSLAVLQGLSRAYPSVPLFQYAVQEARRLVEMRADDVAAAEHGRGTVVEALTALAQAPAPAGALAAAETGVEERLRRLTGPLGRSALPRAALGAGVFLLFAGPLIAASVPLAGEMVHHLLFCPTPAA
jgi:Zn-dependent protease with chaperone function